MHWGICTGPDNTAIMKEQGWDYCEAGVRGYLAPATAASEWDGPQVKASAALPIHACNVLVPGDIKITGPDASIDTLRTYITTVIERAGQVGVEILVFGSGGARNVPDGFDREKARQQILEFTGMAAPIAEANGVTLVAEPLNKGECNIINTVGEAMTYVKEVDHPGFQCLVDSYHMWLEDEPLSNVAEAMPWIKHVHVADRDGRVAPGESGTSDYVEFFKVIKQAGYDSRISVESPSMKDIAGLGGKVLAYLKDAWARA